MSFIDITVVIANVSIYELAGIFDNYFCQNVTRPSTMQKILLYPRSVTFRKINLDIGIDAPYDPKNREITIKRGIGNLIHKIYPQVILENIDVDIYPKSYWDKFANKLTHILGVGTFLSICIGLLAWSYHDLWKNFQ